MTLLPTTRFGPAAAPGNFNELMQLVLDARCGTSAFQTWMWRGQANMAWPVHSALYRRLGTPSEQEMREAEEYLLQSARHKGYGRVDGGELSDIELLAKLQHHGAATRLVDVSRNALVALWFASNAEPEQTGLLVGIHSDHLAGNEGRPLDTAYGALMDELVGISHPYTWEPPPLTPRIAAQHSQFLLSAVSHDPRGSLRLPDAEESMLTIAISPDLKRSAMRVLDQLFDIRYLTMFPDFDGFCGSHSQRRSLFANERW